MSDQQSGKEHYYVDVPVNSMDHNHEKSDVALGVKWDDIDFKRLAVVGTSFYFAEYFVIYPLELSRTHLMTRTDAGLNTIDYFSIKVSSFEFCLNE